MASSAFFRRASEKLIWSSNSQSALHLFIASSLVSDKRLWRNETWPLGKDLAWSTIALRVGAWGNWGEWVRAKSQSLKKRKKSVLPCPKVERNWLKLTNSPSMYKSPGFLRPLSSRAVKRESILAGTNKWLLQRGVVRERESQPNRFLIWFQSFNVLVTMGLDVKFAIERGRVLHANTWRDVEHEFDCNWHQLWWGEVNQSRIFYALAAQ